MAAFEVCRHCRTLLPSGHHSCLRCGRAADAAPDEVVRACPICDRPATVDARFCAGCGQSVEMVGRPTTVLLHDLPQPPDPELIWVDRGPSVLRLWPVAAMLVALVVLVGGLTALRLVFVGP